MNVSPSETTGGTDLQGQRYWRSLNEYAQSPELRASIEREFPGYDPDTLLGMSRRHFMKLAGASMALAGLTLTGCRRWPKEQLAPFNSRPAGMMPGVPDTYASMLSRGGVATGLFVTTVDGRPIGVAGNPLHPVNGDPERHAKGDLHYGSLDAPAIATILDLYDPDRSRNVIHYTDGERRRSDFAAFAQAAALEGKRVAVLSEAQSGPTFLDLKKRFLEKFPGATWTTWEAVNRDNEVEGSLRAGFDRPARAQYDTSKAMVIACFDSEFLTDHPAALKHARGWSAMRRKCDLTGPDRAMNRMYAVAPTLSATVVSADESLRVKPSTIPAMLDALALTLGVPGFNAAPTLKADEQAFVDKLAADLLAHKGQGIVVVGGGQQASVHALAWAINAHLGNLGKTITFTTEPMGEALMTAALAELVEQLNAGRVDALLILGGNPVYDAPGDLKFAQAMGKAGLKVHLATHENETSMACDWHLPEAHYLECWGDGRAWDGTLCLQQPMILPLWDGRSAIEVLAMLGGDEATEGYDLVRRTWSASLKAGQYDVKTHAWPGAPIDSDAENAWRNAVKDGLLRGSAWPSVPAPGPASIAVQPTGVSVTDSSAMQVCFRPSTKAYDGRHANNGWLQELPDTITKIVWDNPALVSTTDAKTMGLKNGDMVRITVDGRSVEAAAFIVPGQAHGCVVLTLGMGRRVAGRIGSDVGFDVMPLRSSTDNGQWVAYAATLEKVGSFHPLATTSDHHLIDATKLEPNWLGERQGTDAAAQFGLDHRVGKPGHGGSLLKQATFNEYKANPYFATEGAHGDVSLQLFDGPLAEQFRQRAEELRAEYPEAVAGGWDPRDQFNDRHAWGMTIDLTTCIGCSACVIACQSENNIPIVGKDQVMMSREMNWIRIDSYYRGDPEATNSSKLDAVFMPVTCVHCENAPCEQVCPVAATVHDTEGLNTMVYNRCVGTRYCSNNCPYKVRRFNYFDYHSKLETDMFRTHRKPGGISNKPWLMLPDDQQGAVVDQIRRMVFNPEVTVRMRGVMEKCTYCTQRIAQAKIDAKAAWAKAKTAGHDVADYPYVADGAVVTACQGACPTEAITFGNLNDPKSKVARLQNQNTRSYRLLEELNTRPRTEHLGLVRNPVEA